MEDCREYGSAPYRAIVVHGGPGAPGSCAGICRGLSERFGVLEHLQQQSSVAGLVEALRGVVLRYRLGKTVLIGHSWGALLSFIFASQYPQYVSKLILVGSGMFDAGYYPQLVAARGETIMPAAQKADIQAAGLYVPGMPYDPDHYCLLPNLPKDMLAFNEPQFNALMDEILPMRASGKLISYADGVCCPVIAIHGRNDPHPVDSVKIPLEKRLGEFKLHVLERCGHDPWKEHYARDAFFALLHGELEGV